jgi:hypothetical protein
MIKSKKMSWVGRHAACVTGMTNAETILVGIYVKKRPRKRWKHDIVIDLKEVGCADVD